MNTLKGGKGGNMQWRKRGGGGGVGGGNLAFHIPCTNEYAEGNTQWRGGGGGGGGGKLGYSHFHVPISMNTLKEGKGRNKQCEEGKRRGNGGR